MVVYAHGTGLCRGRPVILRLLCCVLWYWLLLWSFNLPLCYVMLQCFCTITRW